jgi:putative transposase
VVNQSKHQTYQIANELVKDYDKIAIENLNIASMLKNNKLAKSIQQARWGILFKVLAEAAEIVTRQLVRINPYNTTQTCSDCGEQSQEKVKLNQRIFKCFNCEIKLDRDINSARNILNFAEMGSTRTFLEKGNYLLK